MLARGKRVNERTASCAFGRLLVLGCLVILSVGVASASENEIMDLDGKSTAIAGTSVTSKINQHLLRVLNFQRRSSLTLRTPVTTEDTTTNDRNEEPGCVGRSTADGYEPHCDFFSAIFATRSPLAGDTMYSVHLFFITLPGAVLALGTTFWVVRFEAKRRYCFYKLNQDGSQKDPFAGERTKPLLKKEKHALFIMLGAGVLMILLSGWNYAAAIEYTRESSTAACGLNAVMKNVSYTLDIANEQYEVINPNPAPKSNGTTGASSAADVLAGLANVFDAGTITSNRSCPSGSAVWFAPFVYSMMSLTFLFIMAAGISGLVGGVCGDKNLLSNVGSVAMISASLSLFMFTIFFVWSCMLADSCPVAKPYYKYQWTKDAKLALLPEVQDETHYLLTCHHPNSTAAGEATGNLIRKYDNDWCGSNSIVSRMRQSLKEEQDRTPSGAKDTKIRAEKVKFYEREIGRYLKLCAGIYNLKSCNYFNSAVEMSLKHSCGYAFGWGQQATFSSFFVAIVSLVLAFASFEKAKYEVGKVEYDPLEHDAFLSSEQDGESI